MSDAQPRGPRTPKLAPGATVAEPDGPKPVRYRVPDHLGVRVTDPAGGMHWPGEQFEAVYPPEQEARLIRRGQIIRITDQS